MQYPVLATLMLRESDDNKIQDCLIPSIHDSSHGMWDKIYRVRNSIII